MKFNMGCGRRQMAGYVNVDAWAGCEPDEVWDLEATPWPWPDSRAEEILFIHSLEHMGAEAKVFLAIMSEIYRIAADGCSLKINVPHPRHDNFISDPTHVRPITPELLFGFDRQLNARAAEKGGANTPFAEMLGVDFQLLETNRSLEPRYLEQYKSGAITREELDVIMSERLNVVREYRFELRVRKPG